MTKAGTKYYRPTPLDFLLLEAVPEKGILGGVHWAGRPARHVRQEINEAMPVGFDEVPMSVVQARFRSMKVAGLVEDFQSLTSSRIWARTAAGSAQLANKAEVLGDVA